MYQGRFKEGPRIRFIDYHSNIAVENYLFK